MDELEEGGPDAALSARDQVARCEQSRIDALLAGRSDILREILADDLIHIHSSGRIERRQAYIDGLKGMRFTRMTSECLSFERIDEAAVSLSRIVQSYRMSGREEEATSVLLVTQFWRRSNGSWTLIRFHACKDQPG